MPNPIKINFIEQLKNRFGNIKKLPNSLSLFEIGESACRIYVRYSKVHTRNQSFYGIRKDDLKQLEGFNSIICFLWDKQEEPLFIPFNEFEETLNPLIPASDGQIKAQIFHDKSVLEFYIANVGRFNVERFLGWRTLEILIDSRRLIKLPELNHSQVQTILGSIGDSKGYDIWVPNSDRNKLDWNLTQEFLCTRNLPNRYDAINSIISEIDVIWLKRGSSDLVALFEVEHSTTIYSGLLRFNDLHVTQPSLKPKYSIVSDEIRRPLFLRQINRPTFKLSGLLELCSFLEYKDVYNWYNRSRKE